MSASTKQLNQKADGLWHILFKDKLIVSLVRN